MVRTNLQEFAGDVHVLSNLQVGSNLFANDLAANVLNVIGSIGANLFVGDGGLLSNIATTLDDIIDQGNTVSNTIIFVSGNDATSNTGIITRSNVGISISNTEPTGEYQLTVGSNIFMNTHASNVLTVVGRIGSDYFVGDGGLLSNIATTLDQIVDQGNTISNTVILESGQDSALTSNIGLVSRENVGISVSNSNPTGEFQFGVGSNLFVNTYSSNVLTVEGNVLAQKLTFGTATVTSAYNLSHVTAQGSVTDQTISLTNATTGLAVTSNATVGGNVTAETVISTANVEVGDRLKFASNVFVDDLRVADVAANLVTYDKTTGELMDSGGLFANKLAVVSVQPPSALSANTTTIAKHGTYTVTTSGLAEYSNAWNAFDGDSAVEWTSPVTYGEGDGVYSGTSNLFAGNYIQTGVSSAGEWLAIEFPYKTTLRHMKLTPPATATSYPTSANVYATNDSLTWTEVVNWSDVNPGDQQSNVQTIIVNATESFKKYAMVATKAVGTTTSVALAKWDLFTESFSIDGGKVEMATSAVMGGETTVDQHGPHGRDPKAVPLKKYPEIVFEDGKFDRNDTTNTYTQAGYTVTASSQQSTQQAWKAFDENNSGTPPAWLTIDPSYNGSTYLGSKNLGTDTGGNSTTVPGEYIILQMPNKVKLKHFKLKERFGHSGSAGDRAPAAGKIYGSNDGTHWSEVNTFSGLTYTDNDDVFTTVNVDSSIAYNRFALVVTAINVSQDDWVGISDLRYYGYEEDPPAGDTSVDTTFTSIMNTPQTTGANVYVDGSLGETFTNRVTGPDATGPSATYDEIGKYWELNGELTSNLSVEANTFLSGDAPHSVSMWFNSSNLEANVSNTCVFSISDQEKLDSVNLDLQSNTWHNLTYAYQGEGGSRVTYLDGRKVAEDQAEDTFGQYPPFAMTGYSQGGYVASFSRAHDNVPWHMWGYDETSGADEYGWTTPFVIGGGGVSSFEVASGNVRDGGSGIPNLTGTYQGEYAKLELPYKLVLSSIMIRARAGETRSTPREFKVFGSNDDVNWVEILSETGAIPSESADTSFYSADIQDRGYKYLGLVINKIQPNNTNGQLSLRTLKLYGHRENDLVRLPDPTNVLKYPHIAMTGPAQRGYVASSSTIENEIYPPWKVFNGNSNTGSGSGSDSWVSKTDAFTNGTSNSNYGFDFGSGQVNGPWLRLDLPHKLKLDHVDVYRRDGGGYDQYPKSGYIYGYDGSTWHLLKTFTNITPPSVLNATTILIDSNIPVSSIVMLITERYDGTTTTNQFVIIKQLEYYGTEENSSIPIQIGGGNIDKVANFRVYDKFVGEDQALEIWDAQKDEFGRAKSSMTLQKGRLGIGTDEPQGRLAVLDEPSGLEEFPPRAMTGNKTHFEGHGEFCASVSEYSGMAVHDGWNAFAHGAAEFWLMGDNAGYNLGSGEYEDNEFRLSSETSMGQWIKLEMPYLTNVTKFILQPRGPGSEYQAPKSGELWGSKDNYTWTKLHTFTDIQYYQGHTTFNFENSGFYKYYGLVVTKVVGGSSIDYISIVDLRYFGTREQGQSVLHDGELTLTKSLNVPRIGPALDADDTPRRDRLVVEYNTSTNPTFEGAVRDTSGRGLDGVFVGGASYDATEKALVFDGDGDYIMGHLGNAGDTDFTVSLWLKKNTSGTVGLIWNFGGSGGTGNPEDSVALEVGSSNNLDYFIFSGAQGAISNFGTTYLGKWVHVVATRSGNNLKIYLDGVDQNMSITGTDTLQLARNSEFTIGARGTGALGNNSLNGSISNFKIYDTVLAAEEVKTLYDMGRCDEGHHVVNFSKTRVGIGLGDGEAPRGVLDVRDVGIFNNSIVLGDRTRNYLDVSGVKGGNILVNQGGEYVANKMVHASISMYPTATSGNPWHIGAGDGYKLNFGVNSGIQGYIGHTANGGSLNFTGQHRTFIKDVPFSQAGDLEGLIVSSDQNKYIKMSGGIEAGSNAITTNESLPVVSLSNVVTDKRCFGVISASEDPEQRSDSYGSFVTPFEKEKGDTRVYINSVGEGAIWVLNTNGSLEAGDYITTSNVAGYGQKQDDDVLHNYTVAKITMDCDFEPATQPVQQILRSNVVETYYLGNVHKVKNVPHEFVTTVVGADDAWSNVSISPSDTTYAEWSNLEANTQNTYTLTYTQTSNVVYDTKYTLTTTANVTESDAWDRVFVDPPTVTYAEYSNLEANTQNTYTLTYTRTTIDEKTPDEWSTLESNVQSLYNKVYYQSVEEEVAKDYPGAVAHTRVTDVIENELDEHGQIQWEDHPTETEKAYKIRYLDASGAQTDSANAVHIAAFVGCTYHCG